MALDRRRSVPQQVYDHLREKIELAELKPGESVNERHLATWLGVSRTPIREAIRRLADDGLIEIVPHVGTNVALLDRASIYECCAIRKSLECAAIEEATKHLTPAVGRILDRLIQEQEETVDMGDMARNIAVDSQFHAVIYRLSGFTAMADMLRRVMGEIIRIRHLSLMLPGRLRESIEEHRKIVAAMRSGNGKRASVAMRRHLEKSIASILSVMDADPDFISKNRTS
jgi:GntR family transcriptional regulator, rspAB operon transcriptional repressor